MQINKCGKDVGYKKRLEDIKLRYGEDSNIYKKAQNLINNIKEEKM